MIIIYYVNLAFKQESKTTIQHLGYFKQQNLQLYKMSS